MKSKKPTKRPPNLRDQLLSAMLSEAGRQAVKLIGTVAIAIIMQHVGAPDFAAEVLLV